MATPTEAKQVFDGIAWRYDLTNRVISCGLDWRWRHKMSALCAAKKPKRVLDVACGTGDQILSLKKFLPASAETVGIDLLEKMVARGKKKVKPGNVNWFLGNGIELPFKSESFDAVTITFGLRNLPTIEDYLTECFRILSPNGTVWVLEFSQPKKGLFRRFYYWYLKNLLPVIGRLFTGTRTSYDYLANTIEAFPNQLKLKEKFEAAGFENCGYINLNQGVVAIHYGSKKIAQTQAG